MPNTDFADSNIQNTEYYNDLVAECAEIIKFDRIGTGKDGSAATPVIFLYFGEKVKAKAANIIKLTNIFWNINAGKIKHLGVEWDDFEGKFAVENLAGQTYDADAWQKAVFSYSSEIFQAGSYFRRAQIRYKFIIDTTDGNCEKYFDFIKNLTPGFPCDIYKSLYIIHRQGEGKDFAELIKNAEIASTADCLTNVFVLSNKIGRGFFIEDFEKKACRIIAESVFIADSYREDKNGQEDRSLEDLFYQTGAPKFITFAYQSFEKPSTDIARAILRTFLNKIKAVEPKDHLEITKSFREEQFEENYFSYNFESGFPGADAFKYLPYNNDKAEDHLRKAFKVNKAINEPALNDATDGCFDLFYKQNYSDIIKADFDEADFIQELKENYTKKYTYKDIIRHFNIADLVQIACEPKPLDIDASSRNDFYAALSCICAKKAQNEYFRLMKEPYEKAMQGLLDSANNFSILITNGINSLPQSSASPITENVDQYYSEKAENYFDSTRRAENYKIDINDEKALCEHLLIDFKYMCTDVGYNESLTFGLAKFVENVLRSTNAAEKNTIIQNTIKTNIWQESTMLTFRHDSRKAFRQGYSDFVVCSKTNRDSFKIESTDGQYIIIDSKDESIIEHLTFIEFDKLNDIDWE